MDIEQFIMENPTWINVKEKYPPDYTDVKALVWMFNNFSIETVHHEIEGNFSTHTPHGWWSEKVSHWTL